MLVWAAANIVPVQDTPFGTFIREEASAEQNDFEQLLTRAEQRMSEKPDNNPSLYAALVNLVHKEGVDLSPYFPHIRVSDIKNPIKRNDILLRELLKRSQGNLKLGLDLKGGVAFTFKVNQDDLAPEQWRRTEQLAQAKNIIQQRVDGLGVAEPVIRLRGNDQIEVQMPGVSTKDNPKAIESISAPALLEFCKVHQSNAAPGMKAPVGYRLMTMENEDPRTGQTTEQYFFIKKIPEMKGEIIEQAYANANEYGGFKIQMKFTPEGEKTFARVTKDIADEGKRTNSVGQMAIVLDGKLYSAPSVREEIRGGAEISGSFTQREAIELANVLNNPLQVGLSIDEMYEVGPSLASESRDASLWAGFFGGLLVFVFMAIYYRVSGLVAMLTVVMNVTMVVGALAMFKATITLPGIAALVLTIGMAVDANILIFERMREELKIGKSMETAIAAGFEKAFSTILDANITTLITAYILYYFGSGPVKGFGITLMVGIAATLFCALIASRWMLELLVRTNLMKRDFSFGFINDTKFEFLKHARKAFIGSWTLVAIGVVALAFHWHNIFGIDFVGGDELSITYEQRLTPADIEAVAQKGIDGITFSEVSSFEQSPIGQDVLVLKIQTEAGKGKAFFKALTQSHPQAGLVLIGENHVGASVGDDVKTSALTSIALSILAILLYIAFRFEFGFGLGAIVATIHDILMTVGMFVALSFIGMGSGQFTAPMIAAILMTVGYSINDTIVVFDRIREELGLNPGMDLKSIVHYSINRTLSRTILTSATTLFATLALYLFGSGIIVDFALVFMIGILTGTFSSMFIATPIFYSYHKGSRKHVEESHILPTYSWHDETTKDEKPVNDPA
jgi:SecD/SecF fusion protein